MSMSSNPHTSCKRGGNNQSLVSRYPLPLLGGFLDRWTNTMIALDDVPTVATERPINSDTGHFYHTLCTIWS